MGFLDAVKGLFGSEAVQGVLESTPLGGLGDQVGAHLGEGAALAESVGVDPAQMTEFVPPEVGAAVEDASQLTGTDNPAP